ncbi:MAG: HD domain-containing protein [Candidatus Dojkabacteria bacterium]|nr:HD domain-containing protein [Candidatus Dojkabacteria bacterium]
MMTRQEALALVEEHTKNKNLIKHMLAVEAAMVAYAKRFNEDEEKWSVCGLLHDFDYEKEGENHPSKWALELLAEKGVDRDAIQAIIGHGLRNQPESRPTKMAKALFAVDELTGFIVACALVREDKMSSLEIDSIKKRMKKKDFAKGVSREDIMNGAEELGVDLDEHLQTVLDAMKGIRGELGL